MMARERTTWMKIAPSPYPSPDMPDAHHTENVPQSAGDGFALMANDILSFDRNYLVDPEKSPRRNDCFTTRTLPNFTWV